MANTNANQVTKKELRRSSRWTKFRKIAGAVVLIAGLASVTVGVIIMIMTSNAGADTNMSFGIIYAGVITSAVGGSLLVNYPLLVV